jgi:hypothetical protein
MGEGFPDQPPLNPDEQQATQPQHIDVQTEVPVDVVHNVEQNDAQTEPKAEIMDESAEAFHGRMRQLMDEGRDIYVFRGAGTKNGIDERDVPGAVAKVQAALQSSLEAGKKVAIMFDGDEDNRQKPDVGAIFGIVADSLKDNPDVVAIAAQQESWYYPDTEGGELKSATGTPYETFVFPDSTPGGHASLTQSKDLAQYDNYKQFFVGPTGAIASDQLRDLNDKAQGRPEDNKVEVIAIATHNNPNLTQEFEDKARAADEAGDNAKADGFRATLKQREDNPYGMAYDKDGYHTSVSNEYPNLAITYDETLVPEFEEMRSVPLKGTYEVNPEKAQAQASESDYHRSRAADWRNPKKASEMLRNDSMYPLIEHAYMAEDLKQRRAAENDASAERIEELAGILHDRHISDEYAQAHEGIDFSPTSLAYMEIRAERELETIERDIKAVREMSPSDVLYGGYSRLGGADGVAPGKWLRERESEGDDWIRKDVKQFVDNPDAKLSDYTDYIKQTYIQRELEPRGQASRAAKLIVENVRSGYALA